MTDLDLTALEHEQPDDPDLAEQEAEAVPVTDAPDPAGEIAAAYAEES
ncbi:hypothetical protein NLU66_16485 [Brachybacterium sp. NBEC-018]|nr:hypothetical protein [Brachybacterium sp. NBEC-018]UVY83785.1 hypothetical protein NLU66_16485 [Brachybacterium sp. NBEC-018]